ncbi:MAG TPA: YidC/Oxa1 family membrane protein insertase [Acidimicrobiales bacterium]|nr:YidC/Oxa1 family membrane protein insertase [Acidimicrobiales bacterium]
MFEFLAQMLAFFYDLWPGSGSYGGAIALFTLVIMLVLTPLSIKTTRSMIAMQRVGPELKKLQAEYKDDRDALNREMMAFYKENNINPFASCLPLLLQMPVFFVLYQVLIGLTRRAADGNFNPKYLEDDTGPLAMALRGTDRMMSMGMDLSQSAWRELTVEGLLTALPFIVLVVLVVLTAFIQQRQIMGRNPAAASNPQQQMIGKIMPFIFIPISVTLPAGVVVYFFVSNAVRIGQQALVTRLEYRGDKAPGATAANGTNGAIDAASTEKADKDKKAQPDTKDAKGSKDTKGAASPTKGAGKARANGSGRPGGTSRTGGGHPRSRKKKKRK